MKYSALAYTVILATVMVVVSCSSKQATVAYSDEYKATVAVYQDTVNPQLYYNSDKNIQLIKQDMKLMRSNEVN